MDLISNERIEFGLYRSSRPSLPLKHDLPYDQITEEPPYSPLPPLRARRARSHLTLAECRAAVAMVTMRYKARQQ